MTDRLTQLQEAVDQLTNQFIACFYFLERHHDLEPFGPSDKIPDLKPEQQKEVDSLPPEVFQAGMLELARDLILKEQQIELLISSLPGLENNEQDQLKMMRDLEEELKVAEAQRLEAIKEKEEVLAKLDQVLRMIRRY
ncbi:putative mediator of rna polymerase [Echria macrotheca]|uniref:Mediator of RNA polymerase II transcription subunit 21 n=1 Tax=Echria macrotheca TaxID=438768 RepID=A0AAJ0FBU9_9PEZI|nr:putative mediator of rna polymerase [Echria macrotheca]